MQNPAHKRRDYRTPRTLLTDLPFIVSPRFYSKRGGPRCGNLWYVRRTDNYQHALECGRTYATHFAQYLKDNPDTVGQNLLGRIATDMDFADASARRGYWIGFFSYLEQLIYVYAAQRPVFDDLEWFNGKARAGQSDCLSHLNQ